MWSERSVTDMLWTMLEEKESGKWELILDDLDNERIIQTGYMSSDADVMIKFLGYLNQGVKSDIPNRILQDLDYIKTKTMKSEIIWNCAFMVEYKRGYL